MKIQLRSCRRFFVYAVLTLLVLQALAVIRDAIGTYQSVTRPPPPNARMVLQSRLMTLLPVLPPSARIGLVLPPNLEPSIRDEYHYYIQYLLVPRLVTRNTQSDYLLLIDTTTPPAGQEWTKLGGTTGLSLYKRSTAP